MFLNSFKSFNLILLLVFVYIFGVFDLFSTYLLSHIFYGYELNPVYSLFGWFGLFVLKLLIPLIFYFVSLKKKSYFYMYILLGISIFVVYSNLFLLLIS